MGSGDIAGGRAGIKGDELMLEFVVKIVMLKKYSVEIRLQERDF